MLKAVFEIVKGLAFAGGTYKWPCRSARDDGRMLDTPCLKSTRFYLFMTLPRVVV